MPPAKPRMKRAGKRKRAPTIRRAELGPELHGIRQELRDAMGSLQNDADVELILALMESRPGAMAGARRKARK